VVDIIFQPTAGQGPVCLAMGCVLAVYKMATTHPAINRAKVHAASADILYVSFALADLHGASWSTNPDAITKLLWLIHAAAVPCAPHGLAMTTVSRLCSDMLLYNAMYRETLARHAIMCFRTYADFEAASVVDAMCQVLPPVLASLPVYPSTELMVAMDDLLARVVGLTAGSKSSADLGRALGPVAHALSREAGLREVAKLWTARAHVLRVVEESVDRARARARDENPHSTTFWVPVGVLAELAAHVDVGLGMGPRLAAFADNVGALVTTLRPSRWPRPLIMDAMMFFCRLAGHESGNGPVRAACVAHLSTMALLYTTFGQHQPDLVASGLFVRFLRTMAASRVHRPCLRTYVSSVRAILGRAGADPDPDRNPKDARVAVDCRRFLDLVVGIGGL
jgi:hypothetical protein